MCCGPITKLIVIIRETEDGLSLAHLLSRMGFSIEMIFILELIFCHISTLNGWFAISLAAKSEGKLASLTSIDSTCLI